MEQGGDMKKTSNNIKNNLGLIQEKLKEMDNSIKKLYVNLEKGSLSKDIDTASIKNNLNKVGEFIENINSTDNTDNIQLKLFPDLEKDKVSNDSIYESHNKKIVKMQEDIKKIIEKN